jgi:hypothetical protein
MTSDLLPTELVCKLTAMLDGAFANAPAVRVAQDVLQSTVAVSSAQAIIEAIDSCLNHHPGDVSLLLTKSSALRCLMQMKSAEDLIDEVLTRDPAEFDARLVKDEWAVWPHVLQLPPCSEGMSRLPQALMDGIASERTVHLVRDGISIGVALVHDVSDIRFRNGLSQAMRCKWDFVPAETPYGRIVAHYPIVDDDPASPYRQEFFLNVNRPQKVNALTGYWLVQRLARLNSCLIVLARSDRVQYSRRFSFSEQARAQLDELAAQLINDPKPVAGIDGYRRAVKWHMDHFDFESVHF